MHIRLHSSFSELNGEQLAPFAELLEALLRAHLDESHLICLTPKEASNIRRCGTLGPLSLRVLSIIEAKTQEYFASLRLAEKHIVLVSDDVDRQSNTPSEIFKTSDEMFALLSVQPALYVENAISDGAFFRILSERFLEYQTSLSHLTKIRPFHGGGNTLGDAIAAAVGNQVQGACLCDRDKIDRLPPPVANSTCGRAFAVLRELGVIDDQLNYGSRNPLFHFRPTFGWSVENYIGPHLLDVLLTVEHTLANFRPSFSGAFPTFPVLSEQETLEWFCINFRDPGQSAERFQSEFRARFGRQLETPRAVELASLQLPGGLMTFAIEHLRAGRNRRACLDALQKDMQHHVYRNSFREIARALHCVLAADTRVRFA